MHRRSHKEGALMRVYRVYLSGPIDSFGPLFKATNIAAMVQMGKLLQEQYPDWDIHIPGLEEQSVQKEWHAWLHYDCQVISTCCKLVLMPNWAQSYGCRVEQHYAKHIGIDVIYL